MSDRRRSTSRASSRATIVGLSDSSDRRDRTFGRSESTSASRSEGDRRSRTAPIARGAQPVVTARSGSPVTTTPVLLSRQTSPLIVASARGKHAVLRLPCRSLPPRGYLRQYERDRIRARTEEVTPWVPHSSSSRKTVHPIVRELQFPLVLASRGGIPYLMHVGGAVILLAAAVSVVERVLLTLALESSMIWELPLVIAPFLSLILGVALRLLAFPVAIGLFSLPVRLFFHTGSLNLVTLCETTPHAVRRSCSTSWIVALKLLRRLLAVTIGASLVILGLRARIPPGIVILLTVSGSFSYLIIRIPLLCAPILSAVADYGRRYAVQQVAIILRPCAYKVRLYSSGFVIGWFLSHLIIRSLFDLFSASPWPVVLWVNLCLWVWYSISCIASIVLHQAFLHERSPFGAVA